MERIMFGRYADTMACLGSTGIGASPFWLGQDGRYLLHYIPFEYVNRSARLVIVGITPGNTQLELAYANAQELLRAGTSHDEILCEVKKVGAFGGASMRPNLLKMLRHFRFDALLGIDDIAALWGQNAHLLHSTSVVPHAAFKAGARFNGSFDEIMRVPLLKQCFMDCFVPSAAEMDPDAVFIALGPCPQAALEWCVGNGVLQRRQVLGAFCHPSSAGGSTTRYYLREVTRHELDARNPVLCRCDWLDQAYEQMKHAVDTRLLDGTLKSVQAVCRSHETNTFLNRLASEPKTVEDQSSPHLVSSARSTDIASILLAIERADYVPTKATAKLAEYESPTGKIIYLVKTTSKLNNINLMVHPDWRPERLRSMQGVGSVSSEHRFHSNMTAYPKRLNKGKTKTAFGWQVNIQTLSDLPRFLSAFESAVP